MALAAIAASIAEPPFFITSNATSVASGCAVAAAACGATTAERTPISRPVGIRPPGPGLSLRAVSGAASAATGATLSACPGVLQKPVVQALRPAAASAPARIVRNALICLTLHDPVRP